MKMRLMAVLYLGLLIHKSCMEDRKRLWRMRRRVNMRLMTVLYLGLLIHKSCMEDRKRLWRRRRRVKMRLIAVLCLGLMHKSFVEDRQESMEEWDEGEEEEAEE